MIFSSASIPRRTTIGRKSSSKNVQTSNNTRLLQSLSIQNYALISELDIRFNRGFSVITGETGAGKSILLGAIGLLLGQRAESRMIKAGASRCVIEAEFDLTDCGMEAFFAENELDFDGHSCIIRREFTTTGKSRAFINDTPSQVTQLRELGNQLIDIHSQHQNLLLAQEDFQLQVVDIIAHAQQQRQAYSACYTAYRNACQALEKAEAALADGQKDEEYLRFQLAQLDELDLQEGRQEEMEQESQMLTHAEEIRSALWDAEQLLQGNDDESFSVLDALRSAEHSLSAVSHLLPDVEGLVERLNSCQIELKDIAYELNSQAEDVDLNPKRLEVVNDWLSSLYSVMQKHHVQTEQELIALAEDFRQQLSLIDNSEEHLRQLRQQRDAAHQELLLQGEKLTALRQKAAKEVEKQMRSHLVPLGIPNVQFRVEVSSRPEPSPKGLDQVRFLFCANKNGQLQDLASVASGGEIARVMLSLKALISQAVKQPTIIFDEIDTGVSGSIAERMAEMMREMGQGGRQVISITHLPQIAAMGTEHYRVYKLDDDEGTTSHIQQLTDDERVTELAHMLSGSQLTPAAVENAKALLAHAHNAS